MPQFAGQIQRRTAVTGEYSHARGFQHQQAGRHDPAHIATGRERLGLSSGQRRDAVPVKLGRVHQLRHRPHEKLASAQAQYRPAVCLGIARALIRVNPELRGVLKENGLLSRDSRKKERKKPGRPGARKRFQFSKR